ncbi:unnamed protein product [Cuscuta epithymum]|uniref:Uncharacterized protein n=1 Tax=Cuscuta epithymum TaxID=186058 RepID=A0AAV0FRD6_9ASTE|nr:unnamed protein product [Cuscuta epithymum]
MYRTINVHEDITPEVLKDFYWDDAFSYPIQSWDFFQSTQISFGNS